MAKDYSTYDVEDFLEDESFKSWVLTKAGDGHWKKIVAEHPHQNQVISDAAKLILDLRKAEQTPEDSETARLIWDSIRKDMQTPARVVPFMPKVFRIAASIAVILGCWFGYRILRTDGISGKIVTQSEATQTIEKNTSEKVRQIHLADGSVISLQPNSTLRYPKDFNEDSRTVYLEGEAFFDIAKNPEKPFVVFANEVVTKVLGTSFNIKAFDQDKDITVAVKTGRVSVLSKNEFDQSRDQQNQTLSGLILTPNQKAVYLKNENQLKKTLVEQPSLITTPTAKSYDFNFENKPVSQVFDMLSKAYGVEIIYDEDIFRSCSLTVGLEDEELFEKLKIICKTINASYQVIDTKVLISGKGCKF